MKSYNSSGVLNKDLTSKEVLHPGQVLREELKIRNLGHSSFALEIKVYPSQFSDILRGKRNINASLAIKLENALGISATSWMQLQSEYDLALERNRMQLV